MKQWKETLTAVYIIRDQTAEDLIKKKYDVRHFHVALPHTPYSSPYPPTSSEFWFVLIS